MVTPQEQPTPGRRRVRPYTMTGGRTQPSHTNLEIEALVSTTSHGELAPNLGVEQRAIIGLCRDLISVAEISARLDLPLGVNRILVGDMADDGFIAVYRPTQSGERPNLALLERVLYGLRTI
jgi:hypothetical protein